MNDGATPLFIASQKGYLEVVRELRARGAAVDARTYAE
jgi:ankyrin repeat protein